jgi:signal transduction histidine kinase
MLRRSDWTGSTELHTVMEVIATSLALMVGTMSLVRFYTRRESAFLLIGSGFIGTGLLDAYHALVTSTYFATLMPSPPPSLIPWSWNASRIFLAILLFLSWLSWKREEQLGPESAFSPVQVYIGVGALTLLSFGFFAFVPLPRAYFPEYALGRPEELVAATFFGLAFIGYYRKGAWKTDGFEHWLMLALIVGFVGQVAFMAFSHHLFDAMFDMAHLLKKASYICVLVGLMISLYHAYRTVDRQIALLRAQQLQLIQAEKMSTVGTLAAGVAHELLNPLMGSQNYIEYCQKHTDPNAKAYPYLQNALDEMARCARIVQGLLTFSRSDHGEDESPVATDQQDAWERVIRLMSYRTTRNGVTISLAISERARQIRVKPSQMQQVFLNLLSNAIDAVEGSATKEIQISAERDEAGTLIRVRDSGIGMDDRTAARVFDPFFTTKPTDRGTGLGLSIAKGIVESHGGTLEVASQPGRGTVFVINLPDAAVDPQ